MVVNDANLSAIVAPCFVPLTSVDSTPDTRNCARGSTGESAVSVDPGTVPIIQVSEILPACPVGSGTNGLDAGLSKVAHFKKDVPNTN